MIHVIDYQAGNIHSVHRAFRHFHRDLKICASPDDIKKPSLIVLPGVGSFGHTMKQLEETGWIEFIHDQINANTPFLGICVGLQVCFESSEENPGVQGLGIFKGDVRRFPETSLSVPQIGWNSLDIKDNLFSDFDQKYVYFVHSYYCTPKDSTIILSTTNYGHEYCSAIHSDNVIATQFHLEKSGSVGLQLLERILEIFKC